MYTKTKVKIVSCFVVLLFMLMTEAMNTTHVASDQSNETTSVLENQFQDASESVFYDSCDSTAYWISVTSESAWGGDLLCSTGGLQTGVSLMSSSGRLETGNIPYIAGPYNHGPMWYKRVTQLAKLEQGLNMLCYLQQDYVANKMGVAWVAVYDQNREAMFICVIADAWYGTRVDFQAWYNYLDSEGGGRTDINVYTTSYSCMYSVQVWYDIASDTIKSKIGSQTMNLCVHPSDAEKHRVASEVAISFTAKTNYAYDSKLINSISVTAAESTPVSNMDVLVLYDDSGLNWYKAKMGTSDTEIAKSGMVEDVLQLNEFFWQCPSCFSLQWHASTDWMIYDADGYSGSYTDMFDYYRGWQEEIGWPYQQNPWNAWNHIGMLGDGYSGLHGRHFDYMIMFSQYIEIIPSFAGMNELYHNVAWINLYGIAQRYWTTSPITEGSWTVICHEVGHGFGLVHGDSDDIMDVELGTGCTGKFYPNSKLLSYPNQANVFSVLDYHCDEHWYLDSDFVTYTIPTGRSVNGYPISSSYGNGYHVDTMGCSGSLYDFFAYGQQMYYADENGVISGSGYFRFHDTLPPSAQGYRYMKVYILHTSLWIEGSATILTSSNAIDEWIFKTFTVTGLVPGGWYYVAFGRFDPYTGDYQFTAEWSSVAIYNRAY